jgi:hypothetical protein
LFFSDWHDFLQAATGVKGQLARPPFRGISYKSPKMHTSFVQCGCNETRTDLTKSRTDLKGTKSVMAASNQIMTDLTKSMKDLTGTKSVMAAIKPEPI